MNDSYLSERDMRSNLAQQWRVALPGLIGGTAIAVMAGIAMLAALWFVVKFIGNSRWLWLEYAILCWAAGAVLTAWSAWIAHQAESRFAAVLRRSVAQHLIRLPMNSLAKQNEQTLKQLMTNDVGSLHHMLAHLPAEIAVFTIIPLLSIIVLFYYNGLSAIWVLLPGFIASLYYLLLLPYMTRRDGQARMQVMLDIINKADEYVRGIPVYRIYGQHSSALTAYTQATERFTQDMVRWVAKVATPAAIAVALLQAVATFAIAYWVSYTSDTTTLAATLLFSLAIVTPVIRLGHSVDYIRAGRAAAGRLKEFLQQPLLPRGKIREIKNPPILLIHHATLLQQDRPVWQDLSYTFASGALTAITGPSGVGKTSLLNALAGLVTLSDGSVQLGQTDITALHETTIQQHILLIPQGYDVLNSSVRTNLALTAPQASPKAMQKALDKAQLSADLATTASSLSGGEKQRLNIARAFLSPASVILLDEPTSALDEQHAQAIFQALCELAHSTHKTIVVVTHQQALAEQADAQLVLPHGRSAA